MKSRDAFSLLEMTVVLAIIGLLVGGIMMGANLRREMQVRNVLEDATAYTRAAYQFKDKYKALPGDFDNAISVWGSDATYCSGANNLTPGTCNGNGDGQLNLAGAASATGEDFQFFKQLQLAGFIPGSYTGVAGPGSVNHAIAGTNVPAGSIKGSAYFMIGTGIGYSTGTSSWYAGDYTNALVFGGSSAAAWPALAILNGKESYELDKKADDGLPAFGKIYTRTHTGSPTCTSSDTASVAVYTKSTGSAACMLLFMSSFQQPGTMN